MLDVGAPPGRTRALCFGTPVPSLALEMLMGFDVDCRPHQDKSRMLASSTGRKGLAENASHLVRFRVIAVVNDAIDARIWDFIAGFKFIAGGRHSESPSCTRPSVCNLGDSRLRQQSWVWQVRKRAWHRRNSARTESTESPDFPRIGSDTSRFVLRIVAGWWFGARRKRPCAIRNFWSGRWDPRPQPWQGCAFHNSPGRQVISYASITADSSRNSKSP